MDTHKNPWTSIEKIHGHPLEDPEDPWKEKSMDTLEDPWREDPCTPIKSEDPWTSPRTPKNPQGKWTAHVASGEARYGQRLWTQVVDTHDGQVVDGGLWVGCGWDAELGCGHSKIDGPGH
ncbi:MAG: hypothetical protein N3C12_06170 [Candidatus Binatia bacterium]|nr:hypothetical protein [Candidatus Binatia bacterium]